MILISCLGLSSSSTGTRSIAVSTSSPPTTWPNTLCLKSRWRQLLKVMKNCEPLVALPLLAMLSTPRPECTRRESISSCAAVQAGSSPPAHGWMAHACMHAAGDWLRCIHAVREEMKHIYTHVHVCLRPTQSIAMAATPVGAVKGPHRSPKVHGLACMP